VNMGSGAVEMNHYAGTGWQAELRLGFVAEEGRTLLKQRSARGPLAVQRPFYPEGGLCHVYLLHPPGGVVGGDQLQVHINVDIDAQALITTPGATKFYRSNNKPAHQQQTLTVAAGASLEWFPQESIIFDGAWITLDTRLNLSAGARYIGWEIVCLGRPASNEQYRQGETIFRNQVWRDQQALLVERLHLPGGDPMLTANWGMQSQPVFATMLATPVTTAQTGHIRETIELPNPTTGITLLDDLLVCRYLGDDVEQARHYFRQIRDYLRPDIINKPAYHPRIWNT